VSIALVVGLLAACSGGGSKSASSSSGDSSSSGSDEKIVVSKLKVSKEKPDQPSDDEIITRSVDDVQKFWSDSYPEVYGTPYKPLEGGLYPYTPTDLPPSCGGTGTATYDEVAENAFYCPFGDFVAWDTANLTDNLLEQFGPFTLGIVVAHELGHAIQERHGILNPPQFITFLTEQQADCFAGAYTAWVADGSSDLWELRLSDLDQALGGFLQIRDPVGTDTVNDSSAHGSAFQRINAFKDGVDEGAARCRTYEDGNISFVPEVFTDETDLANQGNLPLDQLEPAVIANLDAFWTLAFQDTGTTWSPATVTPFDPDLGVSCGPDSATGDDATGLIFYCPADDNLYWDDRVLMPYVWENIGDLANAVMISNLFSVRAQHLAGLESDSLEANLQADCFTGVWVGTTATAELSKDLTLSPGDLDEAVASFLQFSDTADDIEAGTGTVGSAFQRLDAFRSGFRTTYDAFQSSGSGAADGFAACLAGSGAAAAEEDSSST
jgi:predicted metalloprotease